MTNNHRIYSLDGLRAISITLVILSHGAGMAGFTVPKEWLTGYLDLGNLGVRIFFVISGFLITNILVREIASHKRLNLKHFYLKRFFRIFPAFYFFLAVITILVFLNWLPTTRQELLLAWTYTENYQPRETWSAGQWYVGHAWSLAVEEQFYLIWPGIIFIGGLGLARKSALALVLIAPLIRIFYSLGASILPSLAANPLFIFFSSSNGRSFETVGDAIAVGCLLALMRDRLWSQLFYQRWLRSRLFWITFIMIFACGILDGQKLRVWSDSYSFRILYELVGVTVMNICIAIMIDRYMRFPETPFGRFLNFPLIVFVGVASYSIYLWQQLFLYRDGESWVNGFPASLIALLLCAFVSFFLIEKPFLHLRDRLLYS